MRKTIIAALCTLFVLTFVACSDEDDVIDPLICNNWASDDGEIRLYIDEDGTFEWGMKRESEPTGYLIIQGRWFVKNNSLRLVASHPCDWCKGKRQFRYKITAKKGKYGSLYYYDLELNEYDLWTHRNISTPLHLNTEFNIVLSQYTWKNFTSISDALNKPSADILWLGVEEGSYGGVLSHGYQWTKDLYGAFITEEGSWNLRLNRLIMIPDSEEGEEIERTFYFDMQNDGQYDILHLYELDHDTNRYSSEPITMYGYYDKETENK